MSNSKKIESKTSIILKDEKEGLQQWTGDQWEKIHFTGAPDEAEEHLERGLPMKVMKFMGLPKSYRHTLYNEFVQDVSQIPKDTASSFYNIVGWICGKNENGNPGSRPSSAGSKHEKVKLIESASSMESVGSSLHRRMENVNILRTDSISNLQIVTPFGYVVNPEQQAQNIHHEVHQTTHANVSSNASRHGLILEEQQEKEVAMCPSCHGLLVEENHDEPSAPFTQVTHVQSVQVLHSMELPDNLNLSTSLHGMVLDDEKKEQQTVNILELDQEGNVVRRPTRPACMSETSVYGYAMSETESEGCFAVGLAQSDKEEEEVKRVTFAPSSETNIYAYHDGEESEEESRAQQQIEAAAGAMRERVVEKVDAEVSTDMEEEEEEQEDEEEEQEMDSGDSKEETASSEEDVEQHVPQPVSPPMTPPPPPPPVQVAPEPQKEVKVLAKAPENTVEVTKKKSTETLFQPKVPQQNLVKEDPSQTKLKPSTSEVQTQLNNDLKTLEDIVKKLYKNLNKKGPVTIVANFKPRQDGELALDMDALTGKPQAKSKGEGSGNESASEKGETQTQLDKTENESPQAIKREPVSIMKTSPSHTTVHAAAVREHSPNLKTRKSLQNLGNAVKPSALITEDKNNNVTVEEPPLKPAIKQRQRMPSLRPASSSYSVERPGGLLSKPEGPPTHYVMRAPSTQQIFAVEQQIPPQQYQIVEPPVVEGKRYLIPVATSATSQHVLVDAAQPKHVYLEQSSASSQPKHVYLEQPSNSQPKHVYLEQPSASSQPKHVYLEQPSASSQPKHVYLEQPSSNLQPKHVYLEQSSASSQPKHVYLEQPSTSSQQPILLESPISQHVFLEHLRPQHVQVVERPPPPTSSRSSKYGSRSMQRSATMLKSEPPTRSAYRSRNALSANSQPLSSKRRTSYEQPRTYSIQNNDRHQQYHRQSREQRSRGGRRDFAEDENSADDTVSNDSLSRVSSAFSEVNSNSTAQSEDVEQISIPIRITTKTKQIRQSDSDEQSQEQEQQKSHRDSRFGSSRKSSAAYHQEREEQQTSSSNRNKLRTSVHIPSGPPKHNSYTAIFKEKQQKSPNTVYVDLTSKGLRKNR